MSVGFLNLDITRSERSIEIYANPPYARALMYRLKFVGRIIDIHAWALMTRLNFVGRILDINARALMTRLKFVGRILDTNARAVMDRLKVVGRMININDNKEISKDIRTLSVHEFIRAIEDTRTQLESCWRYRSLRTKGHH